MTSPSHLSREYGNAGIQTRLSHHLSAVPELPSQKEAHSSDSYFYYACVLIVITAIVALEPQPLQCQAKPGPCLWGKEHLGARNISPQEHEKEKKQLEVE